MVHIKIPVQHLNLRIGMWQINDHKTKFLFVFFNTIINFSRFSMARRSDGWELVRTMEKYVNFNHSPHWFYKLPVDLPELSTVGWASDDDDNYRFWNAFESPFILVFTSYENHNKSNLQCAQATYGDLFSPTICLISINIRLHLLRISSVDCDWKITYKSYWIYFFSLLIYLQTRSRRRNINNWYRGGRLSWSYLTGEKLKKSWHEQIICRV